ncbi:hypothetical protein AVEN_42226-1 [Araneus ventricosus]|uniref:Zinc finger BED domain-containing protein 5 n=1 Tax=Araneus ventricosus TaxID=182803 RepID=A0A4Y2AYU6_ARAVE|nr:hypothetical protein AVEN_42226-1 [Araneus ventricosus]
MGKWLKTGTLKRSASITEIRTTDLVAMELTWISKMIITKCKGRLIGLFRVDGSTGVSDLSILLVIAGYLNVNELEENLLLCYPLTKRCICEDVFNAIQGYFCGNEIDWAQCCGVCTDGGKSMSGCCYKGFTWSYQNNRSSCSLEPLLHPQTKFSNEAFAGFIEGSTQSICQSCKFH